MTQWVVVGTGALGMQWAQALHDSGEAVSLYVRDSESAVVRLQTTQNSQVRELSLPRCQSAKDAGADAVWLLFVKAWQLEPLLRQLQGEGLADDATLIVSHNGLGAGEAYLAQQPNWQVYDLVTTHGAWRQNRYHSVLAGLGQSWIGRRQPTECAGTKSSAGTESSASTDSSAGSASGSVSGSEPPHWLDKLAAAWPPLQWDADIEQRRWRKLAVNCAINPLATLAGGVNGVLRSEEARAQIRAICEEIANVNPMLDADELVAEVQQVIRATAGNRCSMLQDIEAQRATEIDYLNGYVCEQGQQRQVFTRVNCEVAERIRQLELKSGVRSLE